MATAAVRCVPPTPEVEARIARSTYQHLRCALVVLLVLLLVSVAWQRWVEDVGLTSLSAYYFTPVRSVFVASLCALGTALVIYRGNDVWEDIALNLSGFLAFVVAFVPTTEPRGRVTDPIPLLDAHLADLAAPDAALVRWWRWRDRVAALDDGVTNNVLALVVVGVVALGATMVMTRASDTGPQRWARVAVLGVVGAVVAWWVVDPASFRTGAHTTAAVSLFVGIIAVVAVNAWATFVLRNVISPVYWRCYAGTIAAMGLSAALILGAGSVVDWDAMVFWLEAVLLAEFAVFWVVQSVELWGTAERPRPVMGR